METGAHESITSQLSARYVTLAQWIIIGSSLTSLYFSADHLLAELLREPTKCDKNR